MNPKDPNDRFFFPPAARVLPCGGCKHYHGFVKCDAYPDGIPKSVMLEKDVNPESLKDLCNPNKEIRFQPEE